MFPSVSYSPEDHFGAETVHLLRNDCGRGEYLTAGTFISSF